jgi:hypothetical protein
MVSLVRLENYRLMLLVDKRCLVLVVRDRFTKAIFSHLVPAKGTEHYYPTTLKLRS